MELQNGHSVLALALAAARPEGWPAWLRQVVAGAVVVFVTSFAGSSLALWRNQAVIVEKLSSISERLKHIEEEDKKLDSRITRAQERISRHIENAPHGGLTWPTKPK